MKTIRNLALFVFFGVFSAGSLTAEIPLESKREASLLMENASILNDLASENAEKPPIAPLALIDEETIENGSYYCPHDFYLNWPTFAKNFGAEMFFVKMPSAPIVADNGTTVAYNAYDYASFPSPLYGVNFHIQPIYNANPAHVFHKVLNQRTKSHSNKLLSYHFTNTQGYPAMEMHLLDTSTNVFQKERVVVTDCDVYFLYTLYAPGAEENHHFFAHSFLL